MTYGTYDAVVLGGGPGGLATIASLLDGGITSICWIDPEFNGGRLNGLYREISSNTKVGIYLDAAQSSKTCRDIISSTPRPNAVTKLEELDKEKTCQLSTAGDMVMMLIEGILALSEVTKYLGQVEEARLGDDEVWTVTISARHGQSTILRTKRLHLCTGSHPTPSTLHRSYNPALITLDLDETLRFSHLSTILPSNVQTPYKVAVIGNSHSGVLVCRNLYEYSQQNDKIVKVYNFKRRGIKYAKYLDEGIVFDSTGLKGSTADWAKEVMEGDCDRDILQQVDTSKDEQGVYGKYLDECTHIIYAIGYTRNSTPRMYVGQRRVDEELDFDMHSSGFRSEGKRIKGLYGCGIAFPEEVEDPEGHVEAAVGLAKFFKFAERVKTDWMELR